MAKRKTAIELAIESLESEIPPLQQQIDIRLVAISKLRDQNAVARRKRAKAKATPTAMETAWAHEDK